MIAYASYWDQGNIPPQTLHPLVFAMYRYGPPTVRLAGQFFDPVKGPVLFGWIFASHQLGSAVATFAAGETRNSVLTYLPAFVAAGVSCFIAVLFIIAFRRYRPIAA